MDKLSFDAFLKAVEENNFNIIEIKNGIIINVERIPKNKKMIKMVVKFDDADIRTVISNIGSKYEDINVLNNTEMLFVINLEPATLCGFESTAMIYEK